MTAQKTNKTKKIKILVAIILSAATLITAIFTTISLVKTSHIMKFNNPDKIIVYYNSVSNNIVYESSDNEYKTICKMIKDAHKQSILTSIFNGQIFKDVSIVKHEPQKVDFTGFKVNFVYNTPQTVYKKNKIYSDTIWYQSLIFEVSSKNEFDYNSTAIIAPEHCDKDEFKYSYHYSSYSNLSDLHDYLINIFD